jgi:hypothetical protein
MVMSPLDFDKKGYALNRRTQNALTNPDKPVILKDIGK